MALLGLASLSASSAELAILQNGFAIRSDPDWYFLGGTMLLDHDWPPVQL
jgi:hypothetical protein